MRLIFKNFLGEYAQPPLQPNSSRRLRCSFLLLILDFLAAIGILCSRMTPNNMENAPDFTKFSGGISQDPLQTNCRLIACIVCIGWTRHTRSRRPRASEPGVQCTPAPLRKNANFHAEIPLKWPKTPPNFQKFPGGDPPDPP